MAVAAISGSFKGTVALTDKVPPQSYKLSVEGTGRQGFVKGHARVKLEPDGDRTRVLVAAQADVGGMIARVGQRLLREWREPPWIGSTRVWENRWREVRPEGYRRRAARVRFPRWRAAGRYGARTASTSARIH